MFRSVCPGRLTLLTCQHRNDWSTQVDEVVERECAEFMQMKGAVQARQPLQHAFILLSFLARFFAIHVMSPEAPSDVFAAGDRSAGIGNADSQ